MTKYLTALKIEIVVSICLTKGLG